MIPVRGRPEPRKTRGGGRMRAWAERAAAAVAGSPSRRATGFAVLVLCLLLTARLSDVAGYDSAQVPFTVALFALPLLYAFPGARRRLDRWRWPVLAAQAVLTWVPLALFGGNWQVGIGGLLAGLVLLMVPGRMSWPLAGGLLAAEVAVRAGLTGLPSPPGWFGVLEVITYYSDDAVLFFGVVRLAQIVGEVEDARRRAAGLAVTRERLQAARSLQAAVGRRLAGVTAQAAAARRALAGDAAGARAQIAAAGATAREAVAQARAMTAGRPGPSGARLPAAPATGAVIGARLAWAVLVAELAGYASEQVGYAIGYGGRLAAVPAGVIVLGAALQLRHAGAARRGRRPRAWPATLALQAVLTYAFLFPFVPALGAMAPFLVAAVLMLVPGRWRWAGYAAVVASFSVLYAVRPPRGVTVAASAQVPTSFYYAAIIAGFGLLIYGLSRLAGLALDLEGLRDQLARTAAVRERLRVTRDVHDLLGLGLSAVALKADLAGALIGRDDARAAAEIEEMTRICAAARADIRLVTGDERRLSLVTELAAATQILGSAGVGVRTDVPSGPLPAAADEVLAPVLREAVTNVLRHAAATACVIEVTNAGGTLRLHVGNDGARPRPADDLPARAPGHGRGLVNLDARVRAAGGRLATRQAGDQFGLTAELPADSRGRRPGRPVPELAAGLPRS